MPEAAEAFEAQWVVTQEMLRAFGAATGANARIHWDPEYARGTRFGGIVAPGMLITGVIDEWLSGLDLGWPARGELETSYVAPVRPGDRLVVRMTAAKASPSTGSEFDLQGAVGDRVVLRGRYRRPSSY